MTVDPSDFQDLCDDALTALRDADYVRAVALADQLVAAKPDDAVVRGIRAQALLGADAGEDASLRGEMTENLERFYREHRQWLCADLHLLAPGVIGHRLPEFDEVPHLEPVVCRDQE